MLRTFAVTLLVASLSVAGFAAEPSPPAALPPGPSWIWDVPVSLPAARKCRLNRSFELDSAVQRAVLKFAADFCWAEVKINDRSVLAITPYCQTQELDVTDAMRRGENRIEVLAEANDGPAAIALSLGVVTQDGKLTTIVSDGTWLTDVFGNVSAATDLGRVRPELWGLGRRGIAVSPLENYEQWQQTKPGAPKVEPKLWAAPGFEIRLVREAQPDEGSWIAMAFDPQGRLTISREDQGLLRMTLDDAHKKVTRVEPIDVDLKECRGLLYAHGALYANANNTKAFCRLKITEEGKAVDVEHLREFPGDVGHGRNDLALGPNGEIYSIHGDSVLPPGEPIVDRTSPLRESRRGPPRKEAYLLKTDKDGKRWELMCTGLRNPYGVAVHPNGDLFTYDADNEFDMGSPWYRPTRIVQMVSGADYGYRAAGGARWPPEFVEHPDNGLPTIDIGRGSPTATMFGTDLKFPSPYKEAMYALDWSYGRVIAVHLAPRGAGYRAATELFLQGKPLNVTDIAAGPDGAMWLITGGRKTQSALYRVAYTGALPLRTEAAEETHEMEAREFSVEARKVRMQIEAAHTLKPIAAEMVMSSPADDPQIALVKRILYEQASDPNERSDNEDFPGRVIMWKLTQLDRRKIACGPGVSPATTTHFYFQEVRQIHQLLDRIPDKVAEHRFVVLQELLDYWPEAKLLTVSSYGNSRELCRRVAVEIGRCLSQELIAKTQPSKRSASDDRIQAEAVAKVAGLLRSEVQEDRLTALLALRHVRNGWSPADRRLYFETLNAGSKFVGGQGMPTFVAKLREEALASLSEAEKKTLADVLNPKPPAPEPLPPPRAIKKKWKLEELAKLVGDDPASAGAMAGDARRGAVVFRDALCSRCHRAGLTGPAVGPDLTMVARRFSRRDMLASIVTPSAAVAENYRNSEITTADGRSIVGRVVVEGDFRSEKVLVNTDPLRPTQWVEIDKKQIEEHREATTSPMPEGLLDSFEPQEIADLLAFLEGELREAGE